MKMYAATLLIYAAVPGSQSLKDRRQVVLSIIERARARFNVSAADLGGGTQTVYFAFAVVSNSQAHAREQAESVARFVENDVRVQVHNVEIEVI